jgi:hypothetical protein
MGIGAWLWARRRNSGGAGGPQRGTVIFHNTPEPTPLSSEELI